MSKKKSDKKTNNVVAKVVQLDLRIIRVKIRGFDSLISNRPPDSLADEIGSHMAGETPRPKDKKKSPEESFQESCHLMPGSSWKSKKPRFGYPAIAFKQAMIDAANDIDLMKTGMTRAFNILGDDGGLVELNFTELRMRTDMAKTASGAPLVRHRGEFVGWSCILTIRYNAALVSADQLVNLVNAAGFVGVGSWRLKGKKSVGVFGGFEVDTKAA